VRTEQILEKLPPKSAKTGCQNREPKSTCGQVFAAAGVREEPRYVGMGCCSVRLISRMLPSTETGGRRSQIFLQDERIYRQSRGNPAGLAERGGPRASSGTGGEVPINVRKKVRNTSATRVARLVPRRLRAPSLLACRSLGGGFRLYSISERSASRLSLLEASSSVSPVWSKHRRQSPLFTRSAVSHRGHSSGSCVIAGSRSVEA
jgi:hypothetical protein